MVSRSIYERYKEEYWKTKRVKTKCTLRNSLIKIAPGTICRISRKRGGFTLVTDPCSCCGVSIIIAKVHPENVEIVI